MTDGRFAGESPTPLLPPTLPFLGEQGQPMAVWVASTLDSIPPGSILINPSTCECAHALDMSRAVSWAEITQSKAFACWLAGEATNCCLPC